MKRKVLIAGCIVAALVVAAWTLFAAFLAEDMARQGIKKAFPGAVVTIGSGERPGPSVTRVFSFGRISFTDISIERPGVYSVKAKEAGVTYGLFSLLEGSASGMYLKDVDITADLWGDKAKSFAGMISSAPSSGHPRIWSIGVENASVRMKFKDMKLDAAASFKFDLRKPGLDRAELKIASFTKGPIEVRDASLLLPGNGAAGDFSVAGVKCGRIALRDITGRAVMRDGNFKLEPIVGSLFKGTILGTFSCSASGRPAYVLSVTADGLQMSRAIEELGLEGKVGMSGSVDGWFRIEGSPGSVATVKGSFNVAAPGGMLVINDEGFLRNIAERTRQPIEIVRQSFSDYAFTKGTMDVTLEKSDLVIEVYLEGEKGKRDMNVILHDINAQQGAK